MKSLGTMKQSQKLSEAYSESLNLSDSQGIHTSKVANFEKEQGKNLANIFKHDNQSVTSSGKSSSGYTRRGIISYLMNDKPDSLIRVVDLILLVAISILIIASTISFVVLYLSNSQSKNIYSTLGRY